MFPPKIVTDVKLDNDRFVYSTNHSPMCAYIVNFIQRLMYLPMRHMMDNVLENFTVLQVCGDLGGCEFELSCGNSVSSKVSLPSRSPSVLLSPSSSHSFPSFLLYIYIHSLTPRLFQTIQHMKLISV